MKINPTDQVLHLSFDDEAYGRADVFCGMFNKRQVANKTYKPIDYSTTKLPFKDKVFDLVYCTNVLAYAHQPEAIVDEIKRISRKAHIKERSEFAEMIFGWDNTKWIIDVENKELIIKTKNELKIGRFGPFFHNLYATDPVFFDYCGQVPGIMSIAVDWNEEDDIVEEIEVEVEEFVIPTFGEGKEEKTDSEKSEEMFDEVKVDSSVAGMKKMKKVKKIIQSVFRPCQCEYFDDCRIVLGQVTDQIDVRHLKNKHLS
jgi:ubiquinone/menaquinone biosynthesis C-methylase UbiE